MISRRDLERIAREDRSTLEPRHPQIWGNIAAVDGVTTPPGKPMYSYVDIFGQGSSIVALPNRTTLKLAGTPVLLDVDPVPPFLSVKGIYDNALSPPSATETIRFVVPEHAENHQNIDDSNPGPDVLEVHQAMLMPLKTVAVGTNLTVIVHPHSYSQNGARRRFPGKSIDLTSYVPATASRALRVLIYLNRGTNKIDLVSGTEGPDSEAITISYPPVPEGTDAKISAWVRLANGQTTISQSEDVTDGRDFLNGSNEGGSSLPSPSEAGAFLYSPLGNEFSSQKPLTNRQGLLLTNKLSEVIV